jgi:hypothetical protein
MDVVCCDIRVVSSRKRRGERVGVGSRGKYPGAPPHHRGKMKPKPTVKRYLIGLLGKKKKKENYLSGFIRQQIRNRIFGNFTYFSART